MFSALTRCRLKRRRVCAVYARHLPRAEKTLQSEREEAFSRGLPVTRVFSSALPCVLPCRNCLDKREKLSNYRESVSICYFPSFDR